MKDLHTKSKKNYAIEVKGVYKDFLLPQEKNNSIKTRTTSIFRKKNRTVETQHALRDISFNIKEGEFFGIVGRNGSGKSTLLKILAGIYQPTKGSINTVGKLVPFIELGVGFNPELTGRENVYLNGAMLGFSKKEIDDQYEHIVKFAELEQFMDQKLKNYSSGMQVRLAFSVATTAKADILLVDEVLAVGDADFQRKCFAYFRSLKKQKKTVVFVSHDMNAVREYCDRAVLIEDSKLVEEGTSAKVAQAYSRMFMKDQVQSEDEEKPSLRWGNEAVKYSSVKVLPSTVKNEENLTITAKLNVKQDIDGVIVGFSIKNTADSLLFGSNSIMQNQKFENLKKGQSLTINWTVPNVLNDGEYFVNVTAESLAAEPADWWEEAIKFSVRKETQTGFVIFPKIELDSDYGKSS